MLTEILYLVSKGVPWEVAWELPPDETLAFLIKFAGFDGHTWDWRTRSFEKADDD